MLGKLFKHEYIETGKYILPLLGALIGLTLIGCLSTGLSNFSTENEIIMVIMTGLLTMYILGLFVILVLITVFLVMHYYKTMFSARGYLTHTLPVSSFSLVNAKLFTAASWMFLTAIFFMGSVFAILFVAIGPDFHFNWQVLIEEFESIFSLSLLGTMANGFLLMILSCFSGLLMFYASLSIGQLFGQHKILWSIIAYVGLYIVNQIISFIFLLFGGYYRMMSNPAVTNAEVGHFLSNTMFSSYALAVITIVAYYSICVYITKKRLNLE